MTAWCTNVGDSLAVMLRPGNAGSFTACDHIAVLDAALGQIPAPWRTDVLVTIDGAGASHDVVDHLTALNTAAAHGRRGRRVEWSIGWPVDERTTAGIGELRECDWGEALHADGVPDPQAQVADLTGLLRRGPRRGPSGDLARRPAGHRAACPPTGRQAGQARRGPRLGARHVRHQHRHRPGPVARRPPPNPGPRGGPSQAAQGLRRPMSFAGRSRPLP
ncbi:MAG: hypothetical protein ACRDRK_22785 [Pseudonocardia sp.]